MKVLKKWFVILVSISILFASFQFTALADVNKIKFTDNVGLIMFDGDINGHEGVFLLDTGADNSIINSRVAIELGLEEKKGGLGILGLGGISQYHVDKIGLGEWYFENMDLVAMDLAIVERYLGFDLMGLVGGDFLGKYTVTIDYQKEELSFTNETPKVMTNAVSVPIVISDKLVFTKGKTDTNGPEYTFLVDTGATASVYFKNRLEECCPKYSSWPASLGWEEATLLGKKEADMYLMPEFHVGGIGTDSMAIAATEPGILGLVLSIISGEPLHGIIGYTFLKNFRVTFDYPRKQLILEPYEYYVERFPHMYDSVGFMIAYENGAPIVDHILPGTPAEGSGIQVGDKLLEVDGKDATSMDSLKLSILFMGEPGTNLKMRFERDGKRFSKTMKRVYLFH